MDRILGARQILVFLGMIAVLFVFQAAPALAEVYFGVEQYNKPKGAPATYTNTYYVPIGSYDHYIWVKNGEEGNEIKNLTVEINGEVVISSADLRAANPVRKNITLQPLNTIIVTLKGQGGNTAFVEVGGTSPRTR